MGRCENASNVVERGGKCDIFMLVLVDWVERGLKKGRQGQVYLDLGRDDRRLFGKTCVEGVDVIRRHVYVVETHPIRHGREKCRTYFVDPVSHRDDLLNAESKMKLQGFS